MKILIYKKEEDLKPIGGPSGYLFNLNSGLKKINPQPQVKHLLTIMMT